MEEAVRTISGLPHVEERGFESEDSDSDDTDSELAFSVVNAIVDSSDEDSSYLDYEEQGATSDSEMPSESTNDIDIPQHTYSKQQLTKCVIVDKDLETRCISRCDRNPERPLYQLLGTWEVDKDIVKENDRDLHLLGACDKHFNADQNTLHSKGVKQSRGTDKSNIHWRLCLFCNKKKAFFSRGDGCIEHTWKILNRNMQIPCSGLKTCSALRVSPISAQTNERQRVRFVCAQCFEHNGGHLYLLGGRGKQANKLNACLHDGHHAKDTESSLEEIAAWIVQVARSENKEEKERLLSALANALAEHQKTSEDTRKQNTPTPELPGLFTFKSALKFSGQKSTIMPMSENLFSSSAKAEDLGKQLASAIVQSKPELEQNLDALESPSSLESYCNAFPRSLSEFFNGLVCSLQQRRFEATSRKRISRGNQRQPGTYNPNAATKVTILLISVILTVAFPGLNLWFPNVMASLCRKRKLQSSLYAVLHAAHVLAHTGRHERNRERERIENTDPPAQLKVGNNIWNICVLDNIDFKESTFRYGNIFDTTRSTSHATLCMVFQYTISRRLSTLLEEPSAETQASQPLVGESRFTEERLENYLNTIHKHLHHEKGFDVKDFLETIAEQVDIGCSLPPPDVVILRPANEPTKDKHVHEACNMFVSEVDQVNGYLDVACDQAIFKRVVPYAKDNPIVRPFLGQWHTNKAMMSTLIAIFSGYGIFDLAAHLGVRFFDQFEKVVDYQATSRVLELIWVAVGIAICQHLDETGQQMKDIMQGRNRVLQVWYLYFRWAAYWRGHKIGIRRANYDMQFKNLKAFAPLFPVAARSNYAVSVVQFLHYVQEQPELQKLLHDACSINLTQEGHFLAFDEALERYGVKFVKQNIGGNPIDQEQLKLQIQSVQAERERLELLVSGYDKLKKRKGSDRALESRNQAVRYLANKLKKAFRSDIEHSDIKQSDLEQSDLEHSDLEHSLKDAPEMNEKGCKKLFSAYEKGKQRSDAIYQQDVLEKGRRITKGRRTPLVTIHKVQTLRIRRPQTQLSIIPGVSEAEAEHPEPIIVIERNPDADDYLATGDGDEYADQSFEDADQSFMSLDEVLLPED
jgi:hypothetical protein